MDEKKTQEQRLDTLVEAFKADSVQFWQMTRDNRQAIYACLNYGEAYCAKEIEKQAICLDGGTTEVRENMK